MSCSKAHGAAMCLVTFGLYRDIDEYLRFFDDNEMLSRMFDEADTSQMESVDPVEGDLDAHMGYSLVEERVFVDISASETSFRTAKQRTAIEQAHKTISNISSYLILHTKQDLQGDTCDDTLPDQDVAKDYASLLLDRYGST